MSEIIILCNSAQCVAEISSGRWSELHTRDIFTCNNAYSHFRTSGRHLNIFSDAPHIRDFCMNPNWKYVYGAWQYDNVEFIFNLWDIQQAPPQPTNPPPVPYKTSPVSVGASSAINALFYLNACDKYDLIHLVGYTLDEWQAPSPTKLPEKYKAFLHVTINYARTNPRPSVYTFTRR